MSKYLGPEGEAVRLWLISHGHKEMANQWARQLAMKLIRREPISNAECSALAGGLIACADNDEAMNFFNRGKKPDARNRLLDDYELYKRVNVHRAAGKSLEESIKLAGNELNYSNEFNDEWETTALSRYERVCKSIKKPAAELRKCITVADALGGKLPRK